MENSAKKSPLNCVAKNIVEREPVAEASRKEK
jgi:hypothetical protein